MSFIDVKNLCVSLDNEKILNNINFSCEEGEMIGVIGPNGAGKSTLIGCFSSLIPYTGRLIVKGKDLSQISHKERSLLFGIVPQIMPDFLSFHVREIVLMGRVARLKPFSSYSKEDYEACDMAIHLCALDAFQDRTYKTLSGGERQRVCIACAVASKADTLILDEPTNHLDMNHALEVMKLLKILNENGVTIITVMHDINLSARFLDKLLLLNRGEIEKFAPCKEVLDEHLLSKVYNANIQVTKNLATSFDEVTAM